MNTLRNKVQLIGNLGQAEIITLDSGKKLAKFSLATNEHYKDKDGQNRPKPICTISLRGTKLPSLLSSMCPRQEIAIEKTGTKLRGQRRTKALHHRSCGQ